MTPQEILKAELGWSEEVASAWLNKPSPLLGNITPAKYVSMHSLEAFDYWVRKEKEFIKPDVVTS